MKEMNCWAMDTHLELPTCCETVERQVRFDAREEWWRDKEKNEKSTSSSGSRHLAFETHRIEGH